MLPVRLPDMVDYQPIESDDPQPLLGKAIDWVDTTAGEVGVADLDPETPVTRDQHDARLGGELLVLPALLRRE